MMKLSIIIPVFNEEKTIATVIENIQSTPLPVHSEIIVVNDGSTDNTAGAIRAIRGINIVSYGRNVGKGFAIRMGLRQATGDLILIQDADLEYDPAEIPRLIQPILDHQVKVVYGSRTLNKANLSCYWTYKWGEKLLTLLCCLLYHKKITDVLTGYKAFHRDILIGQRLISNGFNFEMEVTTNVLAMGERILEIPIRYTPRKKEDGKKIRLYHGLGYLIALVKGRLWKKRSQEPLLEPVLRKWRIKKVQKHIAEGSTLCDIGCGVQYALLKSVRNRIHEGIGIDKGVKNTKDQNIRIITHHLPDSLPLKDSSVDCITMLASFEHFVEPEKILAECYRVLQKGGTLIITTPAPKSRPLLEWLAFTIGVVSAEEILDHRRYYSKETVSAMVEASQFKVVQAKSFQWGLNSCVIARK